MSVTFVNISNSANLAGSSSVPKGLRSGAFATNCRRVYSSKISGLRIVSGCTRYRGYSAWAKPTLGPYEKRQTSRARALFLRVLSSEASGIPSRDPMRSISIGLWIDASLLRLAIPRYPDPPRASRPSQRGISIAQDLRIATCFVSVQAVQVPLAQE